MSYGEWARLCAGTPVVAVIIGAIIWATRPRRRTPRRVPVELKQALKIAMANGVDLFKKEVHLYPRGKTDVAVLKFARGSGTEIEIDEAYKTADEAIDRFLGLTGPAAGAEAVDTVWGAVEIG
jgi:hypothetical protein